MIAKIETGGNVPSTGKGINLGTVVLVLGLAVGGYILYTNYKKKKDQEKA